MDITRKGFIQILITTVGTVVVGEGCGDSSGAGGAGGTGSTSTGTTSNTSTSTTGGGCGATGTAIAGNHGHVLTIAAADLDSTTAKTYSIQGTAPHDHTVTFAPADLASLKAKMSVMVTSTTTNVHNHVVTATCV